MAITIADLVKELRPAIDQLFDEVYANHSNIYERKERYILEQCGKLYRVKNQYVIPAEYKTGWLKLKEAQGILKLLKGNDDNE